MLGILLSNFIVGICLGLTGLAFMLPMIYVTIFHLSSSITLAYCFWVFTIAGIISTYEYHKNGLVDFKIGLILTIGSIPGAISGIYIQSILSPTVATVILYIMVFLSGISIVVRLLFNGKINADSPKVHKNIPPFLYILIGFFTAFICVPAGAGGPVIVMPILTLLGFPSHKSVGTAMFNTIFISLTATIGYTREILIDRSTLMLIPLLVITFGAGTLIGSRNAEKIDDHILKWIIALASVFIAGYKIIKLLL